MNPETKICRFCGTEFQRREYASGCDCRWAERIYCCALCYQLANPAKPRPAPKRVEATCQNPLCAKVFTRRISAQRFCSRKCRDLVKAGRHVSKQCKKCSKDFFPGRTGQVYCSRRCKINAHNSRFYYENKPKVKAARRKYLDSHRQQTRATRLRYVEKNRESLRLKSRQYFESHRELFLNQKAVRRAREAAPKNEVKACAAFMRRIRSNGRNRCYYCKRWFTEIPHFDHVIALAAGGRHELANLCVSCPGCNRRKSDKLPSEIDADQPLLCL